MKLSRSAPLLLASCLSLPFVAMAEGGAPAAPTTAPTTQRVPKTETPPPGFVRVTGTKFSAFCLPVDQAWVQQALTDVSPSLMPTTRPSDILSGVAKNRDALAKGLSDDLGIEPAKVTKMLNEQLVPQLTKLNTLEPPVVFLVATEQKIISLINNNWSHPRLSYNRLMDQIKVDDRIFFSVDQPMDETLLLANYDPTDDLAARTKKVREAAEKFESETAFSVAARSRVITQATIAQFVETEVFTPMQLKDDQSWLLLGVTTSMAAKYTPMLTGADPKQMLEDLIFERPEASPTADSLDMLKLPPLNQLLPQYRQPYINAARRKSTLAIQKLAEKGGPEAIRKALNAVRKNPPKDGPSMVALVAGATDVDLGPELGKK